MSMQSKTGGGSRASDEDTKTAVKVGEYRFLKKDATCLPGDRDPGSRRTQDRTFSRHLVGLGRLPRVTVPCHASSWTAAF